LDLVAAFRRVAGETLRSPKICQRPANPCARGRPFPGPPAFSPSDPRPFESTRSASLAKIVVTPLQVVDVAPRLICWSVVEAILRGQRAQSETIQQTAPAGQGQDLKPENAALITSAKGSDF